MKIRYFTHDYGVQTDILCSNGEDVFICDEFTLTWEMCQGFRYMEMALRPEFTEVPVEYLRSVGIPEREVKNVVF